MTDVYASDKFDGPQRQHPKIYYDVLRTEELISAPQWQAYDTIICTEHIEHLDAEFHRPLLKWVRDALKPGGQFLGSMPDSEECAGPYHRKEYRVHNWEPILREFFPTCRVWNVQSTVYVWQAIK